MTFYVLCLTGSSQLPHQASPYVELSLKLEQIEYENRHLDFVQNRSKYPLAVLISQKPYQLPCMHHN